MTVLINDENWWQYHQEGYLRLGKVVADDALKKMQERINDLMMGKIRYDHMLMQKDGGGAYEDLPEQTVGFKGPGLDYRKIEGLQQDPLFLTYMQQPLFKEIGAYHYG